MNPGLGFRVVTSLSGSPLTPTRWLLELRTGGWYTTNSGKDWTLMVDGLPPRQVTDVAFDPSMPIPSR